MMDRVLVIAAALLLVGTASYAQPNKEQYELQERCGKRAAEFWQHGPGSFPNLPSVTFNYENHYSARLNKCFFLYLETYVSENRTTHKNMRLFDLNENKEYGAFASTPLACVVRGKGCQSESEWRTLIKPFMED
jgi:hypothetical protein